MLPFLCEITICFVVTYRFALLVMQREPRANQNTSGTGVASRAANTQRRPGPGRI